MPKLKVADIGEDFVNITWTVEENEDNPAGSVHFVKYRKLGKYNLKGSVNFVRYRKLGKYNLAGSVNFVKYRKLGKYSSCRICSLCQVQKIR